jgi:hypothetical protein
MCPDAKPHTSHSKPASCSFIHVHYSIIDLVQCLYVQYSTMEFEKRPSSKEYSYLPWPYGVSSRPDLFPTYLLHPLLLTMPRCRFIYAVRFDSHEPPRARNLALCGPFRCSRATMNNLNFHVGETSKACSPIASLALLWSSLLTVPCSCISNFYQSRAPTVCQRIPPASASQRHRAPMAGNSRPMNYDMGTWHWPCH